MKMKKVTTIVSIVLVVLLMLMLFLPMLFKGQISEAVKNQVNKSLNANVNFESVGLNLFQSFPDLTLNIDNLSVVNKAPFKGDTLMNVYSFQASVDLWSVIAGKQIRIETVRLLRPKMYVHVLPDSSANYNIMKETGTKEDTSGNLNVSLKKYSVEDASIVYNDELGEQFVTITGLNHSGSGDFTKSRFDLSTKTTIDQLSVESRGITFLNKARVELLMDLDANIKEKKFTFQKNEFNLNNLSVKFDGYVAKPDSNIAVNMSFESSRTDFRDIISLIPAAMIKNFSDVKSSGKMVLKGNVKGIYNKSSVPAFHIALAVTDGSIQYPKLPTPIRQVNMDLRIDNPGGSPDNTIIDMKQLHFLLGSDPFDARLTVKTPKSNPFIDTQMKGKLNLGQLKNALPLEDVTKLEGLVNADFQAKGTLGDIKNKRIGNINANGNISLSNFAYASAKLPQEVRISQAQLNLTPQTFQLRSFAMNIGKSDISATGSLNNVPGYVLNKGVVSGNLNVSSNYLDLNSLMTEDKKEKKPAADKKGFDVVEVPDRVDFTMNSNFNKVIFQNLTLDNVHGVIAIRNKRVTMNPVTMNTLGGTIQANGYYEKQKSANPVTAFNLNVSNFDIGKAYESFVTVRQFAPMAEFIKGTFGLKMSMNTGLDNTMMPDWNKFNAQGQLNLVNARVENFKPLTALGSALKINELKDPVLTNVNPSFKIENGRLYVSPFTYKVMNYDVTLGGSTGIDKSIDYTLNVLIPAGNLQQQANQTINKLLKRDVNLVTADKINVKGYIKGKINDPVVTTSAADIVGGATQTVTDQAKQQIQQEVQKQQEKVQQQVQQRVDTVKKNLQKQAEDKLKDIFKKKF